MENDVRLIDANALKKSLRESHDELMRMRNRMPYGEERIIADAQLITFSECILRLKGQPAIDAVQVIRCGECRRRHSSEFCECRPEDAFCSDGERKNDG